MIERLFGVLYHSVHLPLVRKWRRWKLVHLAGCRHIGTDVAIGKDVVVRTAGAVEIGNHVCIRGGVQIYAKAGGKVSIGDGVHVGHQCIIDCQCGISIGDGALLGYRTILVDWDHCRHDMLVPIDQQGIDSAPITIGENVLLSANVIVLKGVTIGERAVVAAGAVVTRDVPPRTVVAGVPAREIRRVEPRRESAGTAEEQPQR